MDGPSLYESDIVAWAEEQARAVRDLASRPDLSNVLDWTHIAEEIESVGRSQVNGVERALGLILVHLAKVASAPAAPSTAGWRREVGSFQRLARKRCSPSMRRLIDIDELWSDARGEAEAALAEWGDALPRGLPARSPLSIEELVDPAFDVDAALRKLTDSVGSGVA